MCMNTSTNVPMRSKTIFMQMNKSVGSFYSYCCCFDIVLNEGMFWRQVNRIRGMKTRYIRGTKEKVKSEVIPMISPEWNQFYHLLRWGLKIKGNILQWNNEARKSEILMRCPDTGIEQIDMWLCVKEKSWRET